MFFLGTQLHVIPTLITLFEGVILCCQLAYFFLRPTEKRRSRFLILLFLLILYNVASDLFPDKSLILPIQLQVLMGYLSGVVLAMYFVYYLYKTFCLHHLRFMATYGTVLFLFCPYLFFFAIPYVLTDNKEVYTRVFCIVPFVYAVGLVYGVTKTFIGRWKTAPMGGEGDSLAEMVSVYLALVFFAILPVILFFGDYPLLEFATINAGILVMIAAYIRSALQSSQAEYDHIADLEEALQQQQQAINHFVHEAQTPLILLQNYLQEYMAGVTPTPQLLAIKEGVQKLSSRISQSWCSVGKNPDRQAPVDFSRLTATSLRLFAPLASGKSVSIHMDLNPGIYVNAAATALESIVNNLLQNAIRYTPSGGAIWVSVQEIEKKVRLQVRDSGVGIPQDKIETIFDPFVRLDPVHCEGMGLGLTIVKQTLEDLKGSIRAFSQEGVGTEVIVVLPGCSKPAPKAPVEKMVINRVHDVISHKDKPFILLVEDEVTLLEYLLEKLRPHYNIYTACNGDEALNKLKAARQIDLIISDIVMDEKGGIALYQAIYEQQVYKHIPFMFLTAKGGAQDKLLGLQMGAIDYIVKPFLFSQLHQKIESVLSMMENQRLAIANSVFRNIERYTENLVRKDNDPEETFEANCLKYKLTPREKDICKKINEGLSYQSIADSLHISRRTVSTHVSNIFSKVSVSSKMKLIRKLETVQE